jgi:hypothetical protein
VSSGSAPDLSLFADILRILEDIDAPYMIIGAFAATVYGVSRVTYDIDIVVDLDESHIRALAKAYPLPRYYADPVHMRNAIRRGMMFNIIDMNRGEKADLIPLSMTPYYRLPFQRRVRQQVEILGMEPLKVWCARPEDVIVGKLMAWAEGRSRRHETDIYEMLAFHYRGEGLALGAPLGVEYVEDQANQLGREVAELWWTIKDAARREADRAHEED